MKINILIIPALAIALTAAAVAQVAPGTAGARGQEQQQRIGQGVSSGQLTGRETANLERREASVNREKRNIRAVNNGHLTAGDRRALNQRQNNISRSIYKDKHNGRVR